MQNDNSMITQKSNLKSQISKFKMTSQNSKFKKEKNFKFSIFNVQFSMNYQLTNYQLKIEKLKID
jgi:hypothetical protein